MLKALAKDASLYTISNVINRILPFLLLPILTHYLTPDEYGIFVYYQVIMNFVIPFMGLNSESAVSRIIFVLEGDEVGIYNANTVYLSVAITAFLILLWFPLGKWVGDFLVFPSFWLLIILVVTLGEVLKAVHLAIWQVKKEPKKYLWYNMFQAATRFVFSLVPILFLPHKLEGLLWGYSISLMIFSLYSFYYMLRKRYLLMKYHFQHLMAFLHYGLPLIPHRIGAWFMGMADRVIITKLCGLAAMGLFSVGYSLGVGVGLVQDAFNRAWVPFFYEGLKRNEDQYNTKLVQLIYLYSVAMIALAVLVTILSPLVFPFLGEKYRAAQVYVIWIAFAYAFNGIYKMFTNFLFFSAKTYILGTVTFLSGLLSVGFSYLFVTLYGAIGAAYSFVIIQIVMCIAVSIAAQRMYPMPWKRGLYTLPGSLKRLIV